MPPEDTTDQGGAETTTAYTRRSLFVGGATCLTIEKFCEVLMALSARVPYRDVLEEEKVASIPSNGQATTDSEEASLFPSTTFQGRRPLPSTLPHHETVTQTQKQRDVEGRKETAPKRMIEENEDPLLDPVLVKIARWVEEHLDLPQLIDFVESIEDQGQAR